ncbi:Uma2 family endonuclease [Fortiea contorta]|uniref:Uma2 family endonuclease n=1 Tax=Fortiea contorta TaxID=1892405 RepID=UPI000345C634|nr:Uma2 family endonuclease [Fortiea contorta]
MKTLAKWTVDDYHRMIAAGILNNRRVELLAGEIVEMAPETPIHYNTAKRNAKYLENLLAEKADVRFNGPITLQNSEPEPDIAIVRPLDSVYNNRHPELEDIFWLIEIAKTNQKKDLELKTTIYATALIQEYWVIDLSSKQMTIFHQPESGKYLIQQVIYQGGISPLAFPEIQISIEQLLN